MRVLILTSILKQDCAADDADTLIQAQSISSALRSLGHLVTQLAFEDEPTFLQIYQELSPDIVVNLVETIGGRFSNAYLFIELLERHNIAFTGCSAEALRVTCNKLLSKSLLIDFGLPTPDWISESAISQGLLSNHEHAFQHSAKYILKPVSECGSLFIGDSSVREFVNTSQVSVALSELRKAHDRSFFAERYISAGEYYVSILEIENKPVVLPIAELKLSSEQDNPHQILRYHDKWLQSDPDFFESRRCFHAPDSPRPIISELKRIALSCWHKFLLQSAARIDFRVDEAGKCYVIDINANPALTEGTGFVRAAQEAKISYKQLIDILLRSALNRAVFSKNSVV